MTRGAGKIGTSTRSPFLFSDSNKEHSMATTSPEPQIPQILLYRGKISLTDAQLQELRDAGYIPICVDDFSDISVMNATGMVPVATIWNSAMDAINGADQTEGARSRFGRLLSQRLTDIFLKPKSAEPKR
jgi:hypothetical protein